MVNSKFGLYSASIIYEVMSPDVIVLNLDDGVYYFIQGSGSYIWHSLISGKSLDEIVQNSLAYFSLTADSGKDIIDFVQKLLDEKLILEDETVSVSVGSEVNDLKLSQTYQKPVLEKFTDMEQALLLDPIHEVDEKGWPYNKNAKPTVPESE